MIPLRSLWARLRRRRGIAPRDRRVDPPAPDHSEPLELRSFAEFAELERALDVWTRWWTRAEGDEPDEQLAVVGHRLETELQKFFGQETSERVQKAFAEYGRGTTLLAADRLFVAFLGRRAAMAVTRKIYSDLP